MKNKQILFCLTVVAIFLLSGCGSSDSRSMEVKFPPTDQVAPIFQISQAPASCRVFAHLLATMPANMTTSDFATRISEEAKSKGADMMLIGQARQCTTNSSLNYSYYGPVKEYGVKDWQGWSFGSDEWSEQGNWETIGYDDWMRSDVHYDYPIIMQVAFLRCQ